MSSGRGNQSSTGSVHSQDSRSLSSTGRQVEGGNRLALAESVRSSQAVRSVAGAGAGVGTNQPPQAGPQMSALQLGRGRAGVALRSTSSARGGRGGSVAGSQPPGSTAQGTEVGPDSLPGGALPEHIVGALQSARNSGLAAAAPVSNPLGAAAVGSSSSSASAPSSGEPIAAVSSAAATATPALRTLMQPPGLKAEDAKEWTAFLEKPDVAEILTNPSDWTRTRNTASHWAFGGMNHVTNIFVYTDQSDDQQALVVFDDGQTGVVSAEELYDTSNPNMNQEDNRSSLYRLLQVGIYAAAVGYAVDFNRDYYNYVEGRGQDANSVPARGEGYQDAAAIGVMGIFASLALEASRMAAIKAFGSSSGPEQYLTAEIIDLVVRPKTCWTAASGSSASAAANSNYTNMDSVDQSLRNMADGRSTAHQHPALTGDEKGRPVLVKALKLRLNGRMQNPTTRQAEELGRQRHLLEVAQQQQVQDAGQYHGLGAGGAFASLSSGPYSRGSRGVYDPVWGNASDGVSQSGERQSIGGAEAAAAPVHQGSMSLAARGYDNRTSTAFGLPQDAALTGQTRLVRGEKAPDLVTQLADIARSTPENSSSFQSLNVHVVNLLRAVMDADALMTPLITAYALEHWNRSSDATRYAFLGALGCNMNGLPKSVERGIDSFSSSSSASASAYQEPTFTDDTTGQSQKALWAVLFGEDGVTAHLDSVTMRFRLGHELLTPFVTQHPQPAQFSRGAVAVPTPVELAGVLQQILVTAGQLAEGGHRVSPEVVDKMEARIDAAVRNVRQAQPRSAVSMTSSGSSGMHTAQAVDLDGAANAAKLALGTLCPVLEASTNRLAVV
jgi:hypothetical protein